MYKATEFKHFTLVHYTKRRVRLIAPSLSKDQERAYVLEIVLHKRKGIDAVKIVPAIASVTIHFDPECLPVANLLRLLEAVIGNLGLKPRQTINAIKHKNIPPSMVLQDVVIGIGGMSCASCALFLEMMLQREPYITRAAVNYVSETARITGYLPREQLFSLVSANGYQAFSIDSLTERKLLSDVESKLIRPGENIPADGVVVKGLSSVNESTVTGSSKPSIKESGHKVHDGCINGSGVLPVRATATGKETMLSGLIHGVDEAQASKLQIQKTVDAF